MINALVLQSIKKTLVAACVKTFAVLFLLNMLSIDFSVINLNINVFSVLGIVLIYEIITYKFAVFETLFYQSIIADISYKEHLRRLELDRLTIQHQKKLTERSS